MSTENEKHLHGMKEISGYLRRSDETVLKMIRTRALPAKKILGNWVSSKEQLDEWVKASTRGDEKTCQAEKKPVSAKRAPVSA